MNMLKLAMLTLFVPLAVALAQPSAKAPDFQVIVNTAGSAGGSLDRGFVTDVFLKKVTRWHDNELIRPVDLSADTFARSRFSEVVLKRSVAAVRSYWQQIIFAGRDVPPPELDSDAAVVAYVAKHKGGIGYVSGNADTHGVRIVSIK